MKTELTFEQNRHLLDLGIPKEKASIWNKDIVIFKLEDFLNGKILPKETEFNGIGSNLIIKLYDDIAFVKYNFYVNRFIEYELIDALYELTCWYYGEYLKSKKK